MHSMLQEKESHCIPTGAAARQIIILRVALIWAYSGDHKSEDEILAGIPLDGLTAFRVVDNRWMKVASWH